VPVTYVHEEGLLRRRRRRRRRTVLSLTLALLLLVLTLLYAVGNVQGIGRPPPTPAAGACSPGRTASGVPLPAPVTVRVNVYNTTFRTGLAAITAKSLAARGFRIADVGNDPHPKILSVSGLIVFGDDGETAARRVALQLAGAKMVNDHRSGRTVDLILGNGYTALVPVSQASAPPVPTTPAPTPSRKC